MSEMLPPIDPPAPPPPSVPPPPPALPWEAPNSGLGSIFSTIGKFVTRPLEAYGTMSLTVDLVRPIAYYVALVLIGSVISQLWSLLFFEQVAEFIRRLVPPDMAEQVAAMLQRPGALQIVLGLVVIPLVMLIVLFIWSALVHAGLAIFGGAGAGFAGTLRVICYARTGDVAIAVPFFGSLFAFVWRRILEVIGLATVHKCDAWKAVLAIILPMLLCCGCIVGAVVMFGAALDQALKQVG